MQLSEVKSAAIAYWGCRTEHARSGMFHDACVRARVRGLARRVDDDDGDDDFESWVSWIKGCTNEGQLLDAVRQPRRLARARSEGSWWLEVDGTVATLDGCTRRDRRSFEGPAYASEAMPDRERTEADRWDVLCAIADMVSERVVDFGPKEEEFPSEDAMLLALDADAIRDWQRARRTAHRKSSAVPETDTGFIALPTVRNHAKAGVSFGSVRREVFDAAWRSDGKEFKGTVGPNMSKAYASKVTADQAFLDRYWLHSADDTLTDLKECAAKSRKRWIATRLSVIKGMEAEANARELTCYLVTLTAPGEKHRLYSPRDKVKHRAGKPVLHYDGSKPTEVAKQLVRQHHDARANAANKEEWFGFWVIEPHSDGTPHLHACVWTTDNGIERYMSSLRSQGVPVRRATTGRSATRRCVVKQWTPGGSFDDEGKPTEGHCESVASYLYPYLLKQSDDDDYAAWRTCHGIRSTAFEGLRQGTVGAWNAAWMASVQDRADAPRVLVEAGFLIRFGAYSLALRKLGAWESRRMVGPRMAPERLYEHRLGSGGTRKVPAGWIGKDGRWHLAISRRGSLVPKRRSETWAQVTTVRRRGLDALHRTHTPTRLSTGELRLLPITQGASGPCGLRAVLLRPGGPDPTGPRPPVWLSLTPSDDYRLWLG